MHQPIIPSDRLAKLVTAASAVTRQTDLTAVLRTTVDTGMELTGAAYGALGVLGEHGALIQFVHAGLDRETGAAIGSPPQGRGLLGVITEMAIFRAFIEVLGGSEQGLAFSVRLEDKPGALATVTRAVAFN